ncbi:MAG: DUF3096 domain-containing protein [Betaproteobacteria bacterium]|nr:MAG: DUF3096 domain-containing protein [Betaproteobacteria bacterium]
MNVTLSLGPLISLIAGILILIMPRLLNYIVALYLIVIGGLGLLGRADTHVATTPPAAAAKAAPPVWFGPPGSGRA